MFCETSKFKQRTYVAALSDEEEVGDLEGSMFPLIPATALSLYFFTLNKY